MKMSAVWELAGFAFLVAGMTVRGAVIRDDFSVPHDYLADGVVGTYWDGFFYNVAGGNATVSIANADTANAGRLTFRSAQGNWENADADGILLYKTVAGDFDAMVRVVSMNTVQWHDAGIMARVADPGDAGAGEDWVVVKHFQNSNNNGHRSTDNGVGVTEVVGGVAQPWLRLARVGNTFTSYRSTDGLVWSRIASSVRNDMGGLPVQVGLWHATFSANEGTAVFDNFVLRQFGLWGLDGGGSWGSTENWSGAVPEGASDWAIFPDTIRKYCRVMLDGDRTLGWLMFGVTNGSSCFLEAGTNVPQSALVIDDSMGDSGNFPYVEVYAGNHAIAVPVVLSNGVNVAAAWGTSLTLCAPVSGAGDLVKSGVGTLTLSSTNRYGGATRIDAGGLKLMPIPAGVKAFYHFDSAAALGQDSSGLANDLTAVGSPSYASAGKQGGAVYLDGSSHFTRGVFPAGVPVGGTPYTIALWIKDGGSPNDGGFCGWGNNAANECNNFRLSGSNGLNNYWYGAGNDFNLTGLATNLKDGQWHHVAVTWDGATRIIYVDGAPAGSYNRSGLNAQAANFVVGKTTAAVGFKGWLDEVLIADRVLGQTELNALMDGPPRINLLPPACALQVNADAHLYLNGCEQAVASLSGAGLVMNGPLVNSTLTVGDGTDRVFSGTLSGAFTLNKVGPGTLTLSGFNFNSGVAVNAGCLKLKSFPIAPLLAQSVAWYDADDPATLTTNAAGQVTLWANKGSAGNTFDATQVTDGAGPTVLTEAFNGRSVLSVDGTTGLRTSGNFGVAGSQNRTFFAVGCRKNNGKMCFAHTGEGTVSKAFGIISDGVFLFNYIWGNDIKFAARPNNVYEVYSFMKSGGTGSANMISDGFVTRGSLTMTVNTTDTPLYLGSRFSETCNGNLAEVIIFNRDLTLAERAAVEAYLMAKWLSGGRPFHLAGAPVSVSSGATVNLDGTSQTVSDLSGSGLVTNGTLTVAGTLAPGGTNEIGTLTLAADVSFAGGELLVDATAGGACDRIDVKGSLNLDGCELRLQQPSQLKAGARYVIATCAPGTLTGTFAPGFEGSARWKVAYNSENGTVTLVNKGLLITVN